MNEDTTLVRRFQQGDEAAFDDLVERHRRRGQLPDRDRTLPAALRDAKAGRLPEAVRRAKCMTRCGYVEKRLRAYADGELPAGEGRQVALHLETCAACRGDFELIRKTVR